MSIFHDCYVHITGTIATDLQYKMVGNKEVARFRVVRARGNGFGGNAKSVADYYTVDHWGDLPASIKKDIKVGFPISVRGELIISQYKGSDGNWKFDPQIRAHKIRVFSKPGSQHASNSSGPKEKVGQPGPDIMVFEEVDYGEDDIEV
ncbi:MAG: single-stranded DNA-binding protein [Melioribacteraceae bacterium]|nr:single-stranded DNA-binding protein [Melioribacteraceae bacterium]